MTPPPAETRHERRSRAATTLAEAERLQRFAFAAELCAGRRVLLLTGDPDRRAEPAIESLRKAAAEVETVETGAFLARSADDDDQVVVALGDWVGVDPAAVIGRLHERADRSAHAVIAVPGPLAVALKRLAPEASAVHQHALELSWLQGPNATDEICMTAPEVEPRAARWALLTFGFDQETLSAASGRIDAAGSSIHFGYLTALEAGHAELRRANARLATSANAKQTAAAAAVNAQVIVLRERIAWHEKRLAQEIENARRNDEMLQRARAALQTPRHRAVESLRYHVLRVPLAGRVVQLMWRAVGRAFRPRA